MDYATSKRKRRNWDLQTVKVFCACGHPASSFWSGAGGSCPVCLMTYRIVWCSLVSFPFIWHFRKYLHVFFLISSLIIDPRAGNSYEKWFYSLLNTTMYHVWPWSMPVDCVDCGLCAKGLRSTIWEMKLVLLFSSTVLIRSESLAFLALKGWRVPK